MQTGSLFISSFEHSLYGCAVFTIGIGRSFYYSGVRESRSPLAARRAGRRCHNARLV